jgi:protoheme IX farnesyltransferase
LAPEKMESQAPLARPGLGVVRQIGLAKVPLCHLMTVGAFTAYVVQRPSLDLTALGAILGVFLLCLGSATLNNYQDREIDRRLRRTRERPLASGQISSKAALLQAALLVISGALGLYLVSGALALPAVGLGAVFLYNGVYTPLKKKTVLAIIPGAVCGSMPVLIGWMAAGGGLDSPRLWILMVVLAVWQLPHFWLVVLTHQEDYRKAGIPHFLRVLSVRQLRQLVFVWVTAFLVLTLCLPLYQVTLSETAAWVLFANALVLASLFTLVLGLGGSAARYHRLFRCLNLSLGIVMGVILVDGIVRSYGLPV